MDDVFLVIVFHSRVCDSLLVTVFFDLFFRILGYKIIIFNKHKIISFSNFKIKVDL